MGEHTDCVFNVGCPSIDVALHTDPTINNDLMANYHGTGEPIDWTTPYILLVQHPVTTSYGDGTNQIMASLNALKKFKDHQKIILWPNSDAGSDDVAKGIRVFRETKQDEGHKFHFFRNFSPEDYIRVLANASCCVGNSSSFIRDGAALGCPAVIIGDRQQDREVSHNVMFSDYDETAIATAIQSQLLHGKYERSTRYGTGHAGIQIAEKLSSLHINRQKKITF